MTNELYNYLSFGKILSPFYKHMVENEGVVIYICVWVKLRHILSVIHYTICGDVCFQFTHFPCDDWENIYCLIIIIKTEVRTIIHCLGLGHESMVFAVCLSIFLQ